MQKDSFFPIPGTKKSQLTHPQHAPNPRKQNTFEEQPDLPRYRLATPASLLCSMEANIFQRPQAKPNLNISCFFGGSQNFE